MVFYQTDQQPSIYSALRKTVDRYQSSSIAYSAEVGRLCLEKKEMISRTLTDLRTQYNVILPNVKTVMDYLWDFPELRPIITSLVQFAKETMGDNSQILLEIWEEPHDRHLDLVVRKPSYENILEELHPLIRRSEELLKGKSGWIHVTTDLESV